MAYLTDARRRGTTFVYTGAPQTYTVPASVTCLRLDLTGAGTPAPSNGTSSQVRRVEALLPVVAGQVLTVEVGAAGATVRAAAAGMAAPAMAAALAAGPPQPCRPASSVNAAVRIPGRPDRSAVCSARCAVVVHSHGTGFGAVAGRGVQVFAYLPAGGE